LTLELFYLKMLILIIGLTLMHCDILSGTMIDPAWTAPQCWREDGGGSHVEED
jgi:hypothetical protein